MCVTGLLVANACRSLDNATDGTSNTIFVAEQSGSVGGKAIRANYGGGWTGAGDGAWTLATMQTNDNCYHTGLTVVEWAINSQTTVANSNSMPYETNTILNASHPGVVQALLADGGVHALNDTIDMDTLRRLCAADDGLPVSQW